MTKAKGHGSGRTLLDERKAKVLKKAGSRQRTMLNHGPPMMPLPPKEIMKRVKVQSRSGRIPLDDGKVETLEMARRRRNPKVQVTIGRRTLQLRVAI